MCKLVLADRIAYETTLEYDGVTEQVLEEQRETDVPEGFELYQYKRLLSTLLLQTLLIYDQKLLLDLFG